MSEDASSSVLDHKGQEFKRKSGNAPYPGFIVMDRMIIQRPVGANQLLTLCAEKWIAM